MKSMTKMAIAIEEIGWNEYETQCKISVRKPNLSYKGSSMNFGIPEYACAGYCPLCRKTHFLEQGDARQHCFGLMKTFEQKGRIDFHISEDLADSRLSLDYLFGDARGQMFGVLECKDSAGEIAVLKAFSGQYNGIWKVEGWAPPLLDVERFDSVVFDIDRQIKELGNRIAGLTEGEERLRLIGQRKKLSQRLMKEIHALYHARNFRSEVKPLSDFFPNGIPTGAGDCCAPKLLNHAAKKNLIPLSLAEFYWGRPNRSGTRQHRNFYAACTEKCRPILGFMLCGAI